MKNVVDIKNGCTFALNKHENTKYHYRNYQCDCLKGNRNGNGISIS